MKKQIIAILPLIFLMVASVYAAEKSVAKKSCAQAGEGNTQCVFEVTGQKIDAPDAVSQLYGTSSMPYALCSSALCQIDKTNPDTSTCVCRVFGNAKEDSAWRNASVGPLGYDKSKPDIANGELAGVTSNFSFANFESKSTISPRMCSFEQPTAWANCFGAHCIVSKNENSELIATCDCPVVKTTAFVSMGPIEANHCIQPEGKVWSAATIVQNDNGFAVVEEMYKQFYPNSAITK